MPFRHSAGNLVRVYIAIIISASYKIEVNKVRVAIITASMDARVFMKSNS